MPKLTLADVAKLPRKPDGPIAKMIEGWAMEWDIDGPLYPGQKNPFREEPPDARHP